MKMDACPFSIQMKGVNVEEGKQEMLALFYECGVAQDEVRLTVQDKGKGRSKYTEVEVTADRATMKWWAPDGRDNSKGGTIVLEGST